MKGSLAGAAIGGLVLVNAVALVAVQQHFEVPAEASPAASVSGSPLPTSADEQPTGSGASATAASAPSGASTSLTGGNVTSPGVFVVAAGESRAWRAVNSGGCDGGSVHVQATQDGGRTWTTLATPPVGAANAIGIDATGHLQLSGQAAEGCAQGTWSMSTTSGSWYASDAGPWAAKGARSGDVIHDGKTQQACESGTVIDIATAGEAADVLCSNGQIRALTAGGEVSTAYQGAGLISIGTTGDNSLVVARSTDDCDGVELDTVSEGSAKPMTCVQGATKQVDLTFVDNHGWLVAAHNTWIGGTTGDWTKS